MKLSNKITLIIGAGASKDINPNIYTGDELIKGIADRVTDRNTPNDHYLSKALNNQLGFTLEKRTEFLIHLENYIISVASPSIDEFLNEINTFPEFAKTKDDFLTIGYVMILAHIFGFEGDKTDITQRTMFEKDTWLSILSKYIDENNILGTPLNNEFKIITFNYDRIIEYYLLNKYKYSNEISQFIDENIYHVYGRAGCLDKLRPKYLSDGTPEIISAFGEENHKLKEFKEKYINHIRIIYDKRSDTEDLKSIIRDSDQICVFGYGFDSINNRRLDLQDCYSKGENFKINIYCGGYPNFNFPYRRKIAEKVRSLIIDADIYYESCSEFLKKCLFR